MNKIGSVWDYPREILAKDVWNEDKTIKTDIKKSVLDYLYDILTDSGLTNFKEWIKGIRVIGSLTGYQYNKKSDLDVHIDVDIPKLLETEKKLESENEALDYFKQIRKYLNTEQPITVAETRPVEYTFEIPGVLSSIPFDGNYDLLNDKWIKETTPLTDDQLRDPLSLVITQIKTIASQLDIQLGEIRRNVIDVEALDELLGVLKNRESIGKFKKQLESKLTEIEKEIESLSLKKDELVERRKEDYKPKSEGNLIFKAIQRYGYLSIIKRLNKLLENDGKITIDELKEIKEVIGKNDNEITQEMIDWFEERTNKHIELVKKYCKRIYDHYYDEGYDRCMFEGLLENAESHDMSKFTEPEIIPYITLTWKHKINDNKDRKQPGSLFDEKENKATLIHITQNKHHPEYWSEQKENLLNKNNRDEIPEKPIDATKMPDIYIAEMIGDWCAMSEELGSNPKDWADKNIGKRWNFNEHQEDLIYKLIDIIWQNKKASLNKQLDKVSVLRHSCSECIHYLGYGFCNIKEQVIERHGIENYKDYVDYPSSTNRCWFFGTKKIGGYPTKVLNSESSLNKQAQTKGDTVELLRPIKGVPALSQGLVVDISRPSKDTNMCVVDFGGIKRFVSPLHLKVIKKGNIEENGQWYGTGIYPYWVMDFIHKFGRPPDYKDREDMVKLNKLKQYYKKHKLAFSYPVLNIEPYKKQIEKTALNLVTMYNDYVKIYGKEEANGRFKGHLEKQTKGLLRELNLGRVYLKQLMGIVVKRFNELIEKEKGQLQLFESNDQSIHLSPRPTIIVPVMTTPEPSRYKGPPQETFLPFGKRPKRNNLTELINMILEGEVKRDERERLLRESSVAMVSPTISDIILGMYKNGTDKSMTLKDTVAKIATLLAPSSTELNKWKVRVGKVIAGELIKKGYSIGDRVKSINKGIEGVIIENENMWCNKCERIIEDAYPLTDEEGEQIGVVFECECGERFERTDIDYRIKWDKPIDEDILYYSEVHPTEIELVKKGNNIDIIGALQDNSLPVLRKLLEKGYELVTFEIHPGADEICQVLDGEMWNLEDFLSNLHYYAPIFEHSHVNATSNIRITGEGLPDVLVDYTGVVSMASVKTGSNRKVEIWYDPVKQGWVIEENGETKGFSFLPWDTLEWLRRNNYENVDVGEIGRISEKSKREPLVNHKLNVKGFIIDPPLYREDNDTNFNQLTVVHDQIGNEPAVYMNPWSFFSNPAEDMFVDSERFVNKEGERIRCGYCGKEIKKGEELRYNSQTKRYYHQECTKKMREGMR